MQHERERRNVDLMQKLGGAMRDGVSERESNLAQLTPKSRRSNLEIANAINSMRPSNLASAMILQDG